MKLNKYIENPMLNKKDFLINEKFKEEQSIPENYVLWRYMSFERFKELIENKKLNFTVVSKFKENDFYECELPDKNEKNEIIEKNIITMGRDSFVSCWTMNNNESFLMWKSYCSKNYCDNKNCENYKEKQNKNVAIKTTFRKLKDSILDYKEDLWMYKVKYIDYERETINIPGIFGAIFHKNIFFQDEREFRLAILNPNGWNPNNKEQFLKIAVDVDKLISEVYLDPYSDETFENEVRLLKKDLKVKKSKIRISKKQINITI